MKKGFEFILVLIIFYGVYSAFKELIPLLFGSMNEFLLIFIPLIISALLLFLYSILVKKKVHEKVKKDFSKLHGIIKEKDDKISQKENEIKKAQSFKEKLVKEAESMIKE